MNRSTFRILKRLPAAALASVVALGAGASSLSFAPSASAEAYAPAASAAPNFSDPAKMELVYLLSASINSQSRFAQSSDHTEYWALSEAQNNVLKTLANPSPSSAELFSAKRQLESAVWTYDYRYVREKEDIRRIMGRLGSAIYSQYPSSDPSYLTPWEKRAIDLMDETYAYMEGLGDSHGEAVQAYQYFNLRLAKLSELVTPNLNEYASSLANEKSRLAAPLAELQQLGVNVDGRVRDFERAAAFMQTLLDQGSYDEAVYEAALHDVDIYANVISTSAELARAIARAQRMVDTSPRGIRSGEYPASAFGTLNRAINQAKRILETAKSAEEIKNEAYELNYVATVKFEKSVKP